jgi:hypothetical protein
MECSRDYQTFLCLALSSREITSVSGASANIFRIFALVSPLPTTLYSKVMVSGSLSMAGVGCFISTGVSQNL